MTQADESLKPLFDAMARLVIHVTDALCDPLVKLNKHEKLLRESMDQLVVEWMRYHQ